MGLLWGADAGWDGEVKRATWALSTLVALAFACAPKVHLEFARPAQVDIAGIERVAVVDFRGWAGREAAAALLTSLVEEKHLRVVERKRLRRVMEEHALASAGVTDRESATELGELLGVDGMIFGEVTVYAMEEERGTEKVEKKVWTGEYELDEEGNVVTEKGLFGIETQKKITKTELVDERYRVQRGAVTVDFRLVRVATSEVIAARSFTRTHDKKALGANAIRRLEPKQQVLNRLMGKVVGRFAGAITPSRGRVKRSFAKTKGEAGKRGIELAKAGLWVEAVEAFRQEVAARPGAGAHYNLGLGLEALGDYESAEAAYLEAARMAPKEKQFTGAVREIRERQAEQAELERQLGESE